MRHKILYFLSMNIAVVLLFSSCESKLAPDSIDFKDTVELQETKTVKKPSIKICVGSMITPEEGYIYYKKLLNYIGKKLEITVNFVEKETYSEVNALLKNGGIDMAFVCGGPYVKGHADFGLELLVSPVVDQKTVYYSYIIVAKDSEIEQFEQLRGKKFAFADPMSNTGKLIPTAMLYEFGETPEDFFKDYVYTYSHDESIKAVAQGIVDGAAVDSLIWEHMNKVDNTFTAKTKIIKISEPYGIPPVVVRYGLDKQLKKKLRSVLLNMHNEQEGKRILDGMFIDKFVEVDDSIYDTIRALKVRLGE